MRATGPDAETRARLILRAGGRCEKCGGSPQGGSVHHRRARGMGGTRRADTNELPNLLLLCGSGVTRCHGEVESNRFAARRDGLLVSQYADPAAVPVLLRGQWYLLGADGKKHPVTGGEQDPAETATPIPLARVGTRT